MSPDVVSAFAASGAVRVMVERRVLRFWRPLDTARGPLRERPIFLVTLRDEEGGVGIGEAAPLEAFGTESEVACAAALARTESGAVPVEFGVDLLPPNAWTTPAAAAAVELAWLDLRARREGKTVAGLLAARLGAASPCPDVAVNALIGGAVPDDVAASAAAAVSAGFHTLKLKVGLPGATFAAGLGVDRARVEAARQAAPHAVLRLDANGAWADPAEALQAILAFAPFDIAVLEQPLPPPRLSRAAQGAASGSRRAGPTWARRAAVLAGLRARSPIPLAADESVVDDLSARALLAAGAVEVLVLKPMRLGGLLPACAIAAEAAERGVRCVVTGFLGGAVERAGALHLALALEAVEGAAGARAPGLAHGLAAGDWLVQDVAPGPMPVRGRMGPLIGGGHGVSVGVE